MTSTTDVRGARGSGVVVAATAAISALNYLYTITLIWLLPPRQYVVVGSISALLLIWGTVSGAAIPWVLAREVAASEGGSDRRSRAASFAVGATAVQAVGAAAVTGLVAADYASSLTVVAALISVTVIFVAATAAGYLQGLLRFRLLATLRTAEVVMKIGTGVLLVLLGFKAAGALMGFAVGAALVAVVAVAAVRSDFRWVSSAVWDRELWGVATGLFSIQAGAALLASLDIVVGSLALGRATSFATYQAANVLGRVPLFVGAAISVVAFPLLSKVGANRVREARDSLWLYARVAVPVLALTITIPYTIVSRLFPASYGDVFQVLPWAATAGFALGLVNLVTTYFQAAGVIRRTTVVLAIGVAGSAVLDWWGLRVYGDRGLAAAVALGALLTAGVLLRDVQHRWPGSLRSLGRTAIGSAVLASPLWLLRHDLALWLPMAVILVVAPALLALLQSDIRPRQGQPRVLHLGYEDPASPGAGGGSVRTHEINRRLTSQFDITVVCARYPGCRPRVQDGVRYIHTGLGGGRTVSTMSYFLFVPWVLLRHRSDLVVEDFGAPLSSVAVPWMTRRPVVGVVQWLFARQKAAQYRLPFSWVESVGVRSHRQLVAVSGELGAELQVRNPRAAVAVIYNGLDRQALLTPAQPRSDIRYLGRLEIAQKGLDVLLQAYAAAASELTQDLIIGGDGPDRAALETLAASLGVGSRVRFAGRIDMQERLAWLAGAEMVVMPSRYETFGMVAAEALAGGTPVVATDIPCLREVVDSSTGMLVPPGDADALAAGLLRLAHHPGLRRQLGKAGPAKVAGLNWDHLAQQQAQLYCRALAGERTDTADLHSPAGSAGEASSNVTVTELFQLQAARSPGAPAVSDGGTDLSYTQLDRASAGLARYLRQQGLPMSAAVGVCMPRSAPTVVAAVAVMRAGYVYVPLDPAYPPARLATMCAAAQVALVVVQDADAWAVPDVPAVSVACRSTRGPRGLPMPSADSPAYIIFTSGSTGAPKGVQVLHRNLSAMLQWLVPLLGDDLNVTAATTSFSFDPSIMELFGPLVAGGKVELAQDVLALGQRQPTFLAATPSVAAELLRTNRIPSSVRALMVGGEVLPPALAAKLLALPHISRLLNAYGPTEATVMATVHQVCLPVGNTVPIGRAVPGTDVIVVDQAGQPVPAGEAGELLIVGPQVSAGYINDPELTARQFVEVRGSDGTVRRAYRTGDRGRSRPDGILEFQGRLDRQLKVRGFRVEPAEIENALMQLPQIAQAAVRVSGREGQAVLVACVVPLSPEFDEERARTQLRSQLATYLIPSRFVVLEELPLTSQGKLDTLALDTLIAGQLAARRRPQPTRAAADGDVPMTAEERTVARLAQDILSSQQLIRPADDFLDDLGGSSLTLVQLLSTMETEFGCDLPIRSALEDSTIAGLARLAHPGLAATHQTVPAVCRNDLPLFVVNPYVGAVVNFRRLVSYLPQGAPVVGVQVHDAEPGTANQLSVSDLADAAVRQIKAVQPHGPYLLGGHSAGGLIAVEAARQLQDSGNVVLDVLLIDSPVIRTRLDHVWAELSLNWPELRNTTVSGRVRLLRTAFRSRISKWRRPDRSSILLAVERAARHTNIAVKRFRPARYPGHVTLLWTDHGLHMARGRRYLGWDRVVTGQIHSDKIPGDHISMFDPPHVAALASYISQYVDRERQTATALPSAPPDGLQTDEQQPSLSPALAQA